MRRLLPVWFVGVVAASYLAVRFGFGQLPEGVSRRALAGAAALAGIGFTVSLFVSELAFGAGRGPWGDAKIAVLLASIASGALGAAIIIGTKPTSGRAHG